MLINLQSVHRQSADKAPTTYAPFMLRIKLLGTPEIYQNDQLVPRFRTRKAQALLIYLAATDRRWTRDSLATLFWPETDDATARKNLRDILPSLRRQLGDYLLFDDERIGLKSADCYTCDVTQFTALLEQALPTIDLNILTETLARYRGEFLEGYATFRISADFELWVLRERERLHQLALTGFTTLCQRQQEGGAYAAALTTNWQLLKLAPWDEAVHRQQMLLLAQCGQHAAALAHYATCRQILADELGVEPTADTTALYKQIQSGAHQPTAVIVLAKQETRQAHGDRTSTSARASIPHNLPTSLTELIGYAEELTYIQTQLVDNQCRLLTLVGMGGIGKTHLALESARQIVTVTRAQTQFADGVYFVQLDGIREASEAQTAEIAIAAAIAQVVGHTFSGSASPQEQLQAHLANKKMLLILDNVEHLVEGARFITTVLQHANSLAILATSREKLNLRGEYLLELRGLLPRHTDPWASKRAMQEDVTIAGRPTDRAEESIAQKDHRLRQASDAVTLFAYHAQLVDRHFCVDDKNIAYIVRICELIDGLPLAIEMAAKWLEVLDCAKVADEIAQNLDFLKATQRDTPKRHQTLRSVFDQSWRLLGTAQQTILARLSIFQPNFSLAAASMVAKALPRDVMILVQKSLLIHNAEGSFTIHRSIRHFARERLHQSKNGGYRYPEKSCSIQPEEDLVRNFSEERYALEKRYASFYLELLAKYTMATTSAESSQIETEILKDIDNVKSALPLAIQKNMWTEIRATTRTLAYLYDAHGWFLEGVDLYALAVKQLMNYPPVESYIEQQRLDTLLGDLIAYQGWLETRLGHFASALSLFQSSLQILRSAKANIESYDNAMCEHSVAVDAAVYVKQVLGASLSLFGWLEITKGQPKTALALLQESIPLVQRLQSISLFGLAYVMYQLGDYQEAKTYAQEAIGSARQHGVQRYETYAINELGRIEQAQGRYAAAEQRYLECYKLRREANEQSGLAFTLCDLGDITRLQGEYHLSATYLQRGLALATEISSIPGRIQLLWALGNLALARGDIIVAKAHFIESQSIQQFNHLTAGLPTLGWAHIELAEFAEAERYFLDVVQAVQPFSAYGHLVEAVAGLVILLHIAGQHTQSIKHLTLIKNHPAATQETKDRVRTVYARTLDTRLAAHSRNYHPSPDLGQTIVEIIDLLQQPAGNTAAESNQIGTLAH